MNHKSKKLSVEESYLILFRYLMLSKHKVIKLGAEYDLTGMQTITLLLLDTPKPMNSFRKVFNCDASNITGLVDGLEHKQLASRYESPTDRRIKMVKLKSKGEKVRSEMLAKLASKDSPLLYNLDDHEKETFIRLLQKMTASAAGL